MSDIAPRVSVPAVLFKVAVSQIPLFGPIAAEFIGETFPRAREQRVLRMLEDFGKRLETIEGFSGLVLRKLEEPTFQGLFEDALFAAARATSIDRTQHIAALLRNGLSGTEAAAMAHRHLLGLLGELNDVEVLLVCLLGRIGRDYDEFWRRHEAALTFPHAASLTDDAVIDEAVLTDSYFLHMERLGLLEPESSDESATSAKWRARRRLTRLGMVLVKAIGEGAHSVPTTTSLDKVWHIAPEHLETARLGAREYWAAICAALESRARGMDWRVSSNDINCSVQVRGNAGAAGFIHPFELWLWFDYPIGKPKPRSLWVLVGCDELGWFWEYRGRRSTSLESLASLILAPLITRTTSG